MNHLYQTKDALKRKDQQAKQPKEMSAGMNCIPSQAFPGFGHGAESP